MQGDFFLADSFGRPHVRWTQSALLRKSTGQRLAWPHCAAPSRAKATAGTLSRPRRGEVFRTGPHFILGQSRKEATSFRAKATAGLPFMQARSRRTVPSWPTLHFGPAAQRGITIPCDSDRRTTLYAGLVAENCSELANTSSLASCAARQRHPVQTRPQDYPLSRPGRGELFRTGPHFILGQSRNEAT